MTHPSGDVVPRLVERRTGGDTAEDRAAALIRGALVPRDPSFAERERISRAVATCELPRARARVALRLALAAVCLLAGAATVRGYEMVRRAGWLGEPATTPKPKPAPAKTSKRQAAPTVALARPAEVEIVPAPAFAPDGEAAQDAHSQSASPAQSLNRPAQRPPTIPSIPHARESARPAPQGRQVVTEPSLDVAPPAQATPLIPPAATRTTDSGPVAVVPPSASPQPLVARASAPSPAVSQEIREMDRAMGYLRRDRDAVSALGALDGYIGRYPHGVLEKEARLARIDALLLLGRDDQALQALELTSFDPGLRLTELLVIRAELRAAKDCRRAEQDFGAALDRGPDARLLERILYGRGACRTKLQDFDGASDDVQRYLERFPAGSHADWARRWLASRYPSSEIGR